MYVVGPIATYNVEPAGSVKSLLSFPSKPAHTHTHTPTQTHARPDRQEKPKRVKNIPSLTVMLSRSSTVLRRRTSSHSTATYSSSTTLGLHRSLPACLSASLPTYTMYGSRLASWAAVVGWTVPRGALGRQHAAGHTSSHAEQQCCMCAGRCRRRAVLTKLRGGVAWVR